MRSGQEQVRGVRKDNVKGTGVGRAWESEVEGKGKVKGEVNGNGWL